MNGKLDTITRIVSIIGKLIQQVRFPAVSCLSADSSISSPISSVRVGFAVEKSQNYYARTLYFAVSLVIIDDIWRWSAMTICEILKLVRKELNISQETLARDLNVSYATLNRWENNKAKPSRLAMDKLKNYCASKAISHNILSELENYR